MAEYAKNMTDILPVCAYCMVLSVTGHANDNFQAGSMHHLLGYLSAAHGHNDAGLFNIIKNL